MTPGNGRGIAFFANNEREPVASRSPHYGVIYRLVGIDGKSPAAASRGRPGSKAPLLWHMLLP